MKNKLLQTAKFFCLTLVTAIGILAGTSTVKAGPSFETADMVLVNGGSKEVDFNNSDAKQYFKFTTDGTAGWYSINLGRNAGNNKYFDIYDGPNTYNNVFSRSFYGNGNDTYILSLRPNHTYYVVCSTSKIGGTSRFAVTKINDDYNNFLSAATPIALGQTVEGNIEVSDQDEADTFCFSTSRSDSFYEMSLACTGSSPAYAYIYQGNDESYDYYSIYASSSNTSYETQRLLPNKTYYVKIFGSWDDATSYKFSVKEIRDDAGSDFSNATTIKNNKTVGKTIQHEDDTDFFKFKTGKQTTAYRLSFKNRSKSGMYITVYSNNDIASAVSGANNIYVYSANTRYFYLNLKKNHTYYVKVTGYGGCEYSLTFNDMKTLMKKTSAPSIKVKKPYTYSNYAYVSFKNKYPNAVYEIYRSTSKNSGYKKVKTFVKPTGDTITYYNYSLKHKRTYYYKMRYYVKDNGKKIYSKWSKVKSVKIR